MSNKTITLWGQSLTVFSQHWFKIGLAVLVLYAFLSRDFSFRISIQAPNEIPVENRHVEAAEKKKTLTDASLSTEPTTSHFDFIPSWGKKDKSQLIQQLQAIDRTIINDFIQRFTHVASAEQEKYGVPSSITIAHALLKSKSGQSAYVTDGYNYFALACSDDWNGGTQDGPNGCIRRYDNAWQSFRDHSLFLTTGKNAALPKIGDNDQAWAKALGKLFSEEEGLEEQLLNVIGHFGL